VLTVEDVHVSYSGSEALRGVELTLSEGELVAVIGPNGAGKSTLLRTISGLVQRSAGKIMFDGCDLGSLKPDEIVRRGIIHVPEGRMVLGRMSVRENLLLGAYARPRNEDYSKDLSDVLALFPRLQERLDQLAGLMSGGEQQMLAIARGLMGRPKVLMLDEPSLGLAPLVVTTIFEVLDQIRSRGITVLLVEQNAERALSTADHAYVLDLGSVTARGVASELLQDERVRNAYLGI
jgi:branched-chain amino acid transport system ATP-binding protein